MVTIKLYSYLTEDNDRVYLGIPLVVNRVKHGDIITNDENQYRLLVEDGRTGRLKHYVPNNCTVDRLNAAVMAEAIKEQAEPKAKQETEAINAEVEATGKMTIAQLDRLNELESQAAKAKPKPQFSFVGRGKPQPASPEWAAYERHLHIDYNDTIASFLAGTR